MVQGISSSTRLNHSRSQDLVGRVPSSLRRALTGSRGKRDGFWELKQCPIRDFGWSRISSTLSLTSCCLIWRGTPSTAVAAVRRRCCFFQRWAFWSDAGGTHRSCPSRCQLQLLALPSRLQVPPGNSWNCSAAFPKRVGTATRKSSISPQCDSRVNKTNISMHAFILCIRTIHACIHTLHTHYSYDACSACILCMRCMHNMHVQYIHACMHTIHACIHTRSHHQPSSSSICSHLSSILRSSILRSSTFGPAGGNGRFNGRPHRFARLQPDLGPGLRYAHSANMHTDIHS